MTKEALKLALEALERIDLWLKARYSGIGLVGVELEAITAIKEALAQPEQEPAYRCQPYSSVPGAKVSAPVDYFTTPQPPAQQEPMAPFTYYDPARDAIRPFRSEGDIPLYTTPPQRTWVGLNLDERAACYELSGGNLSKFADQIEAKLCEKNT